MKQAKVSKTSVLKPSIAKAALNEAVAAQAAYGPCSMAQIGLSLMLLVLLIKSIVEGDQEPQRGSFSKQKNEGFIIQYAQVVTQLKNADDQVKLELIRYVRNDGGRQERWPKYWNPPLQH
ncbi:uncharacterized protein [Aristolochia californica]|uniref:uncharacterized protein isoform X2 n=1 Tax=Aristolochia californica TaxID=171875 RepID=UPI0035E3B0F4